VGAAPAARQAHDSSGTVPSLAGAGRHVLVDGSHTKSGEQSVVKAHDTAHVPLAGTHKKGLHGVF